MTEGVREREGDETGEKGREGVRGMIKGREGKEEEAEKWTRDMIEAVRE